jgi:hypothetical protein
MNFNTDTCFGKNDATKYLPFPAFVIPIFVIPAFVIPIFVINLFFSLTNSNYENGH